MVETVLSCLILIIFFFGFLEFFQIIRGDIYVQKIAREAAREVAITGSIEAGREKSREIAEQYFKEKNAVKIDLRKDDSAVICQTEYKHKLFKIFSREGYGKEVTLHGEAIFAYWDRT